MSLEKCNTINKINKKVC